MFVDHDICFEPVKKILGGRTVIIKEVPKSLAREMIIKNHYSHKWGDNFGVFNFGIFEEDAPDKCYGVAAFGHPKNPKGSIYKPQKGWTVIELNRMWIDDHFGKNTESLMISTCLNLLKKYAPHIGAVQSFADGRIGCGTIYKASNFKYYGFHYTTFFEHKKTGEIFHVQGFTDRTNFSRFMMINAGVVSNMFKAFKVKTYRYVYTLRKGYIFPMEEKPYPIYEKGIEFIPYTSDIFNKKKILNRMLEVVEKKVEGIKRKEEH